MHTFRFGLLAPPHADTASWLQTVRRAEQLGYSTLLVPDHLGKGELSGVLALLAAGTAARGVRLGTLVRNNDLVHPVVTARDFGSLQRLTGNRGELGLGAGWNEREYRQVGLKFDRAGVRIARLGEAVALIHQLFAARDAVTFRGEHYQIDALPADPLDEPPPILVGGGGRLILQMAAREADIIGVHVRVGPRGPDWSTATAAAATERLRWIEEAGRDRILPPAELQLSLFGFGLDDRAEAERASAIERTGLSQTEISESPYFLFGSLAELVGLLQERRERFGVSYVVVPHVWMETFAPVVRALAGS